MPRRRLRKSLQDYLSKIKNPNPNNNNNNNSPQDTNANPNPNQNSKTKTWFLSACKLPIKTQSFAQDRTVLNSTDEHRDRGVTLADIDKFLLENFRSLWMEDNDNDRDGNIERNTYQDARRLDFNKARIKKKGKERNEPRSESKEPIPIFFDSPRFLVDPPPDVSGSSRFFITRASSSSLIEEARSSLTVTEADNASTSATSSSTAPNHHDCADTDTELETEKVKLPDDCIAILTQSRSPYEDFRRSMKEMVEARRRTQDKRIDWDFMEELLFCYLRLNEKKSYKYILSAFVDVIMALRRKSRRTVAARPGVPARSPGRFLDSSARIARRKNNNNNNNDSRRRDIVA